MAHVESIVQCAGCDAHYCQTCFPKDCPECKSNHIRSIRDKYPFPKDYFMKDDKGNKHLCKVDKYEGKQTVC